MSPCRALPGQQHGLTLLMALLLLLIGWAAWLAPQILARDDTTASMRALLRARDALIGRAVSDANRPGSLPCPDFRTQVPTNQPNDGFADLLAGSECPSSVGWLPWATLDLGDQRDGSGSRLWYVISRTLRDDDSAQPIHSDTPTTVQVDGSSDIAALIIAPQGALAAQNRPSLNIRDYLDGSNGDGDTTYTAQRSATQNDLILPLRRSELMAAVEHRIVNDVRTCLKQHAASTGRYPWPVPLNRSDRRSRPGSLFGRLPQSQASAGPGQTLTEQIGALLQADSALARAPAGSTRLAAAQTLSERLHTLQTFFQQSWLAARAMLLAANNAVPGQTALRDKLTSAANKPALGSSEQKALEIAAELSQPSGATLLQQLQESGIDLYPARLEALAVALRSKLNDSAALQPIVTDSVRLLDLGQSTNSVLAAPLSQAQTLGHTLAQTLQLAAGDRQLLPQAIREAEQFAGQLGGLQASIASQRLNLPPDEIEGSQRLLVAAESLWRDSINDTTLLASRLSESLSLLNRLSSANQPVSQARDNARLAVQATRGLLANQASAQEIAVQLTSVRERLGDLALAMRNNGDNLTLNAIQPRLAGQASLLPANGAAPPPGTLRTLAAQADDLAYLATLLASHANALAYASRGPADKVDTVTPESLHALAENALLSLEGSTGTLARLQQAMNNPGNTRQKAADDALAASQAAVAALLAAEQGLPAGTFAGGTATASALIWQGTACSFLQTGGDTPSWWFANAWEQLIFLQISGPDANSSGRLRINDLGRWPFVIIAAGGRLGQQARPGPAVADYLEDQNADASRDGDASAPAERFRQSPVSPQFNDQLAY